MKKEEKEPMTGSKLIGVRVPAPVHKHMENKCKQLGYTKPEILVEAYRRSFMESEGDSTDIPGQIIAN